jgi:Protein of unknown function (DUF3226)
VPQPKGRRLLVEGDEDKRVVPELVEARGIPWGENRNKAIVDIGTYDGIDRLTSQLIAAELKASGLKALGLLVDANGEPERRWQALRGRCLPSIDDLPSTLPEHGLIHRSASGIAFGIWMMPDNRQRGMLETFLAYLVPPGTAEDLWRWTDELCEEARQREAPFKDAHRDKARLHAWLAFQDPPGRSLHHAIFKHILAPDHPKGDAFFDWFVELFGLEKA